MFIDGRLDRTLRGHGRVDEFIAILEGYVNRQYGPSGLSRLADDVADVPAAPTVRGR